MYYSTKSFLLKYSFRALHFYYIIFFEVLGHKIGFISKFLLVFLAFLLVY